MTVPANSTYLAQCSYEGEPSRMGLESDQWPLAMLPDYSLIGAGGNGWGLIREIDEEGQYIVFAEVGGTAIGPYGWDLCSVADTEASGYNVKPNALAANWTDAKVWAWVQEGTGSRNKLYVWDITPDTDGDYTVLNRPISSAVFDRSNGDLVPCGAVQFAQGSQDVDAYGDYFYLHFNDQGNLAAANVFTSATGAKIYLGRVARAADPRVASNYSFMLDKAAASPFAGSNWGTMAAAKAASSAVVYDDAINMGKHFLTWWNGMLDRFIAAKFYRTGTSPSYSYNLLILEAQNAWGPWATIYNGTAVAGSQLKHTAQPIGFWTYGSYDATNDRDDFYLQLAVSGDAVSGVAGWDALTFQLLKTHLL